MSESSGAQGADRVARVVIADDDPLVRMLLEGMLSDHPRTELVGVADDGGEAIAVSAREHPDVVLLDLALPDVEPLTVIDRLVRQSPAPAVLVITSFESDEQVDAAMRAGAADHVVRSAERDEIVARILWLAGRRAR